MSNPIWIQETFINASENAQYGETDVYETWTDDKGKLYKDLRSQYGKCTGKVYIDDQDGNAKAIGYVFQKRQAYDRSKETYLQETWVTLHDAPPTKTVTYHYL